jgi:hypothetical protein
VNTECYSSIELSRLQSKSSFIKNVEVYTNKVQSDAHKCIRSWLSICKIQHGKWSIFRIDHNPLYDDREINFEIDEVVSLLSLTKITFLDSQEKVKI